MIYRASLDTKSKIITAFVLVVVIGGLIQSIGRSFVRVNHQWIPVTIASVVVLMIVGFFLHRPLFYVLRDHQLVIKRPINDVVIPLSTIRKVLLPDPANMKWTIRVFGNGGFFGYFGSFYNSTFGNMTFYATRTRDYVMIFSHDNKKIVLTPNDISLKEELEKRIASLNNQGD